MERTVAEQEEEIKRVRVVQEAERSRQAVIIAAEAQAQEQLVKDIKGAEAAEQSAHFKAREQLVLSEAAQKSAELDAAAAALAAQGERAVRLAAEMGLPAEDPSWAARGTAFSALASLGQAALGRDDGAAADRVLERRDPPSVLDAVGAIVLARRGREALEATRAGRSWSPRPGCYLNPLHDGPVERHAVAAGSATVAAPLCARCRDDLDDGPDDVLDEPRRLRIHGVGQRWSGIDLEV